MTKTITNEAKIQLPNITKDGFRASQIHMDFVKEILESMPPIDNLAGASYISYPFDSAKIDTRGRLEITGGRVFEIRNRMKENTKLRKIVEKYVKIMKLDELIYKNFSDEFEKIGGEEDDKSIDEK